MSESHDAEIGAEALRHFRGLRAASTVANLGERKRQWYTIRNAAKDDAGPAELLIYDEIDSWFGVSAEQLAREIATIDSEREIVARINSPGGDIFDGIAILNALRGHKGKVTTVVDGVAASIASVIAMAGDEIVMNRNSEMMVHNGQGIVVGDAEDMLKMADLITNLNTNIASIYAEKAGGTTEEWLAIMAEETWYTAEEAVKAGLADRVEAKTDASKAKAKFDFAVFNHAGRSHAPAPRIPVAHNQTPLPVEVEADKGKEPTVASLNESALQKLGLDAEADEDAVSAAIEALAEEAAEKADEAPPVPPAEPTIDEATKVAAKFGMTVVNATKYEQMEATVAELSAARENALVAADEVTIKNALDTGRIDPATANDWRAELAKNREGITALIAKLPANKAVPVDELGHGVSREEQPEDSDKAQVFAQLTGFNYGKEA